MEAGSSDPAAPLDGLTFHSDSADVSGPPIASEAVRTDPLTVTIGGTSSGLVTSNPAGITCAGTTVSCTGWFGEGTPVTLTATPDPGMVFVGWVGCEPVPAAPSTCTITVDRPQSVRAVFGSPLQYYHLDVLGSVRMITNAAGAVVRRHDYFAFGEDIEGPTGDPRRFTGKERDAETELHYFGARYYRSVWGRFTSVDPVMETGDAIADPERWNRYSYARNGPLRFTDPDGRSFLPVAAIVVTVLWILEEPANAPGPESSLIDSLTNLVEIGETTFYSGLGGVWGRYVLGPLFGRGGSALAAAAGGAGGRFVAKTLNQTIGDKAAMLVKAALTGRQPITALSALSQSERAAAAAFYREVASRTVGKQAANASLYNIARAEVLEGKRLALSPTLAEFVRNGFK